MKGSMPLLIQANPFCFFYVLDRLTRSDRVRSSFLIYLVDGSGAWVKKQR